MNEYIDTREGWREVDSETYWASAHRHLKYDDNDAGETRYWVREAPVPPLPTEPYTVIRVTWREDESEELEPVLVRGDEQWSAIEVDQWHSAAHIAEHITGFEVLAEPRKYDTEQVRKDSREAAVPALIAEAERYFDGAWIPGHERLFSYDHQRALFERLRSKFGVGS